jgi:hypothetical protein
MVLRREPWSSWSPASTIERRGSPYTGAALSWAPAQGQSPKRWDFREKFRYSESIGPRDYQNILSVFFNRTNNVKLLILEIALDKVTSQLTFCHYFSFFALVTVTQDNL